MNFILRTLLRHQSYEKSFPIYIHLRVFIYGLRGKSIISFAALIFVSSIASAEIYKCRDKNGKLSFSNRPCAAELAEEKHSLKKEHWIDQLKNKKTSGTDIIDIFTFNGETIIKYSFIEQSDSTAFIRKTHKLSNLTVTLINTLKPAGKSVGLARIKVSNKPNQLFEKKKKSLGYEPSLKQTMMANSNGQEDGGSGVSISLIDNINTSLVLQLFNNAEEACSTNNKNMFYDLFSKKAKSARYGMLTYKPAKLTKYMGETCRFLKRTVIKGQLNNAPEKFEYGLLTFVAGLKSTKKNYYTRLCIYKKDMCKLSVRAVLESGTLRMDEH